MTLQRRPLVVRAFNIAMRVSEALLGLPNRIVPPPFRLMQIGSAFWQSRALYVAARLDLATVLAGRRLATRDLAIEVGADPRALGRLLRMLAAMGIFEEAEPGIWRNNRLSEPLQADRSDSVRSIIMMHNSPEMSRPWHEGLEEGIRTGAVPFEITHDTELYSFMDEHRDFDALFAEAMDRVETLIGDSFVTEFDWTRFTRIIDVGGSRGSKSLAILKRHQHLNAVVVDRAQIIVDAPVHWAARGEAECLPRLRSEAGDILSSVPAAVDDRDAYLLSAVLHGFDDGTCIKALSTVAAAAAPVNASIVLLEMVMPDSKADLTVATFDMQMFMGTKGRERTMGEWEQIFAQSGVALQDRAVQR